MCGCFSQFIFNSITDYLVLLQAPVEAGATSLSEALGGSKTMVVLSLNLVKVAILMRA